jgi:hypothetical protein
MSEIEYQYNVIYVGDKPYCVWDWDIKKQNLQFLESLEPRYFVVIADNLSPYFLPKKSNSLKAKWRRNIRFYEDDTRDLLLNKEDYQYTAIQLRSTYSHALETLFSLLIATLQSPICTYAWIRLYNLWQLRDILEKIQNQKSFISYVTDNSINWEKISSIVFRNLLLNEKDKKEKIVLGFSKLWQRLAHEYLNDPFINEYNSIKHGLRIKMGGSTLAFTREKKHGISPENKKTIALSQSEYGTSYLIKEKLFNKGNHYQFYKEHINWDPESMIWSLKLISMSIENVISNLLVLSGKKPEKIVFHYPSNLDNFEKPWTVNKNFKPGSFNIKTPIQPALISHFTKAEMEDLYYSGKAYGIKRIVFGEDK